MTDMGTPESGQTQIEFTVDDAIKAQDTVNQLLAHLAEAKAEDDQEKIKEIFGRTAQIVAGSGIDSVPIFLTLLDTAAGLLLDLVATDQHDDQ